MKDYLKQYGRKQRFQEGGSMPAGPEGGAPPAGGPEGGAGGPEEILAVAQATLDGDMEAAAQLGVMVAPMILEQAQAQGGAPGGAPAGGPEGGAPMGMARNGGPVPANVGVPTFGKGGRLIKN